MALLLASYCRTLLLLLYRIRLFFERGRRYTHACRLDHSSNPERYYGLCSYHRSPYGLREKSHKRWAHIGLCDHRDCSHVSLVTDYGHAMIGVSGAGSRALEAGDLSSSIAIKDSGLLDDPAYDSLGSSVLVLFGRFVTLAVLKKPFGVL